MLAYFNHTWNEGMPFSLESRADSLELDSIAVLDAHTSEAAYLTVDEEMLGGHFILCAIAGDSVSNVHLAG